MQPQGVHFLKALDAFFILIVLQVLAHADVFRREAQGIEGDDISPTMAYGISEGHTKRDSIQLDAAPFDASISASLAVEMQAVLPSTQVNLPSLSESGRHIRGEWHADASTDGRCL